MTGTALHFLLSLFAHLYDLLHSWNWLLCLLRQDHELDWSPLFQSIATPRSPSAMTKSTNSIVSGEVISIENPEDLNEVRKLISGKIKGKIILLGKLPQKKSLSDTIEARYSIEQLNKK